MSKTANTVLLAAQAANMTRQERLDTLTLRAVQRKVPKLPIHDAVTRAEVTLTINGPSRVEIDVHDPGWLLERSGILDPDRDGRLNAVAMSVDTIPFRLTDARRTSGPTVTLTFQDLAVAVLQTHDRFKAAKRGKVTRAQFLKQLTDEVKAYNLSFTAADWNVKQPVERPDLPDTRPAGHDTGFDDGTKFDVAGAEADAQQMRFVATALGVADQENASERATLALLVAGIGESAFRDVVNSLGYGGVFQGQVAVPRGSNWFAGMSPSRRTEEQARSFLKGGRGYQGGGAIVQARENPDKSPGMIAADVEKSWPSPQLPTAAAAERHYQQWIGEARKILAAWNGGTTSSGSRQVLRYKSYRFTRGLPGHREDSWEAMQRLADEVNWRLFAIGGVVEFTYDDYLIARPARHAIRAEPGENGTMPPPPGLLEMPTYEWMHGRLPAQVQLHAHASAWSVLPSEVVALYDMGPISGRWLVETFTFDLLNPTAATIDLIKPVARRKEPAAEVKTDTVDSTAGETTSGSGKDIVRAPKIQAGAMRPGTTLAEGLKLFLGIVGHKIGKQVIVTTGTQHDRLTTRRTVSDHWEGWAADMGTAANGVVTCDQICEAALELCGFSARDAKRITASGIGQAGVSLKWRQFRVQVFWKSNDPGIGDHYDHVHVGLKPLA